jgi:hypothetical protein
MMRALFGSSLDFTGAGAGDGSIDSLRDSEWGTERYWRGQDF